jgi:putative ABC transport system permease protein
MSRFSVFTSRLRALLFKKRLDRDLDAEIRFHLEMQAEDNIRAGMDSREAAQAASRSFGGVMRTRETYRERRALHPFETIAHDLRYAWRMMLKNPGFTTVAVVSLAIGIGANCATFSAADAFLLRPLPVPRPSEVLTVGSPTLVEGFGVMVSSYPDYVDIRDRSKTFDGLVAFTNSTVGFATQPDAPPALRMGMLVSGNFFSVIGVEPQLGRAFRPEENQVPGRDAVLILGHDFWEHEFAADRSILGRTVRLNGIEFTIVGVAPPEFTGLDQFARFEFYAPLMMWPRLVADPALRPLDARGFRNLTIKGRLKAGVTRQAAQTELSVIAKDLEQAYPETNRNRRLAVRTELQTRIAQSPEDASLLAMLTLLAAAVLLVACGNVAGLLISRAPVRAREVALRLAIGAGRARIVRQLVTESVLIAVLGGGIGLAVGYVGVLWGRQFRIPTDLTIATSFELDRRALLVSLVVALVSAFLFGLARQSERPALI